MKKMMKPMHKAPVNKKSSMSSAKDMAGKPIKPSMPVNPRGQKGKGY